MPEKAATDNGSPGAGAGLTAYQAGVPVTYDPALVARMLRNLRSARRGQADNRRSLVGTQRTCRATTVQNRPHLPGSTRSRTGHRTWDPRHRQRGRTD